VLDVVAGEKALTTTGGKTWDAARKLCTYLEASWESLPVSRPVRILELGSGTGWLGMTLASNVADQKSNMGRGAAATLTEQPGGATVTLTEQPGGGAMEWLQENIDTNRAAGLPLESVRAEMLDWLDFGSASTDCKDASIVERWTKEAASLHLLIGSDLVYDDTGVRILPKVIKHFAQVNPKIMILYAHTLHRFDHMDIDFFQGLREEGLMFHAVAGEHGKDGLEPDIGNGYLDELFPEKRIAVFQIVSGSSSDSHVLPWSDVLSDEPAAPTPCPTPSVTRKEGIIRNGAICVLLPEAKPLDAASDELLVRLDCLGPFGSGEHPTTALQLQGMQALQESGRLDGLTICDYGCGSGVLALAACRLGASRCVGVDLILDALDAAQANKVVNDASVLELYLPRVSDLDRDIDFFSRYGDWRSESVQSAGWRPLPETQEGSFDLVAINIVVGSLCRAAPAVRWLAKPGGKVLLSGFRMGGQVDQVKEAYGVDFDLTLSASLDGWALLVGTRRQSQMASD